MGKNTESEPIFVTTVHWLGAQLIHAVTTLRLTQSLILWRKTAALQWTWSLVSGESWDICDHGYILVSTCFTTSRFKFVFSDVLPLDLWSTSHANVHMSVSLFIELTFYDLVNDGPWLLFNQDQFMWPLEWLIWYWLYLISVKLFKDFQGFLVRCSPFATPAAPFYVL